jgi:hypothetical protein
VHVGGIPTRLGVTTSCLLANGERTGVEMRILRERARPEAIYQDDRMAALIRGERRHRYVEAAVRGNGAALH